MTELPKKPHYSIEELAAWWCVSRRVVRHQIDKGALPAKRIGREYRIEAAVVEQYGQYATT
jgi:excisionase family DNA binding protein